MVMRNNSENTMSNLSIKYMLKALGRAAIFAPFTVLMFNGSAYAYNEAEIDIVSPVDHNSANPFVFISFVAKNTHSSPDSSTASYSLIVNDGRSVIMPGTASPNICSSVTSGLPSGTYAETCGCYFDLRQVDTNRSVTNIAVWYQNYNAGTNFEGKAYATFLPHSGPVRPPATAPMCPAADTSTNLQPIVRPGPDQTATSGGWITLDGSASYDPEGTALSYSWIQTSGPTITLTGANTATPTFPITNVTTATDIRFQLVVTDAGGRGAAENLKVTVMPPANAGQCSPWNRDALIDSLVEVQPNGSGTNYSLKHFITGQVDNDLKAEVARLDNLYPNFKTLEIKSYISNAGSGSTPTLGGGGNAAPTMARRFENPVSPAPQLYWMGAPFMEGDWYRLDTKLNLYDDSGNFLNVQEYPDNCLYETVYVKLDNTGSLNGLRAAGPSSNLIFSNGAAEIKSGTSSGGNTGVILDGERIAVSRDGIRLKLPGELSENGQGREIAITEDDLKKTKKKVKKRWRFWKREKE